MAVVLAIDLLTPRGLAVSALYCPVVLYAMSVRRPAFTVAVVVASTALTLLAVLLSPPPPAGFPLQHVWANRLMSLVAIAVTGWLAFSRFRQVRQLESSHAAMKQMRHALEEQHRLLTVAGSLGGLGGWAVDLRLKRIHWSDEVARIHGRTAGYAPASIDEAMAFYMPVDRERVRNAFKASVEQRVGFEQEAQIQLSDGRHVWVRALGQPVADESGRVVRIEGALQDITVRKMADDALHTSLLRFRQLADAMPLIVWTASIDGNVDFATKACFEYVGIRARDLQNGQWISALHPDDQARCLRDWHAAMRSSQGYTSAIRIRRHDGCYRWHLSRAVLVHEPHTGVAKWYGSAVDIHEQREAEQQASDLAARLTTTLESISDAFFTLDTDWRFTYLNSQAERLLRRQKHSLLGRNLWKEFSPIVGTAFHAEFHRAVAEQRPVVFEQHYVPLESWFEVHAYPSQEGLAVYFQDITERRGNEMRLRLLELAVSRLNDIVLITEAEPVHLPGPRVVFVNDAFERRTGYRRDEVIGKTPRLLQGPDTSREELDRIGAALDNWEPVRAELINYTKSGDAFWIELDIVPIADERGWFTHWVAVERDITERKQLEDRLRQFQRMDAIGQLTGGVAHDFNNLLTVMLGNAELLVEQLAGQPNLAGAARLIVQAGVQGAELTKRLLAFARRQPLDPQVLDVNRTLTGVETLLARTLGEHVELEFACAAGLWPALADPSQLQDALLNLAINARDAMPAGGRLTVETSNAWVSQEYAERHVDLKPGQYVMIAVSDTGTGIPAEHLARIFEPFFSTKVKGKGTGLGLAMVYGFLKQSEGHVNVYSERGQGTTFKMYIPRAHAAPVPPAPDAWTPHIASGQETILLVEDDELVRRFAREQLSSLGYRVISQDNGARALEVLRGSQPVDLLFTDIVMPGGISGRQLADQARVLRPGLKVLYTSGYTENAIVHHGRLDPGVRLLSKPYRRAELARKVRDALLEGPHEHNAMDDQSA
jgi:PAS domain S-box-containing protein